MRRGVGIAMMLLILLSVVTGIGESRPAHLGPPVAHIFAAVLLLVTVCLHVWLNRKAFIRYFVGTKNKGSGKNGEIGRDR